jgi:hypothetical protein
MLEAWLELPQRRDSIAASQKGDIRIRVVGKENRLAQAVIENLTSGAPLSLLQNGRCRDAESK